MASVLTTVLSRFCAAVYYVIKSSFGTALRGTGSSERLTAKSGQIVGLAGQKLSLGYVYLWPELLLRATSNHSGKSSIFLVIADCKKKAFRGLFSKVENRLMLHVLNTKQNGFV